MQRAHRRMGIPGAAAAVAREHLGQRIGVLGQVDQRHGTVLDEADRLAVALQAHHDVQAGFADLPQSLLRRLVKHLDHRAGQAQVAHQLDQRAQLRQQCAAVVAAELDQQNRRRLAQQRGLDRRTECWVVARQIDHRSVDQFDRAGPELDDVLGRVHRCVEAREVHHPQQLGARQGAELEPQAAGESQRALGADQQVRQVDAAVVGVGPLAAGMEDVEVVAADAAHHPGPARLDLVAVCIGQAMDELGNLALGSPQTRDRTEVHQPAIGQPGLNTCDVVHHVAVGDAAAAAGVVAGHAAQRGLGAGRHIDRVPQAVRLEVGIEMVEHDAGFDLDRHRLEVQIEHRTQVLAGVDHQRRAGGLPTLRAAAAARQQRHFQVTGDRHRGDDIGRAARHEHAHRHDLVDRRIGGVAPARRRVEHHLTLGFARQAQRQVGGLGRGVLRQRQAGRSRVAARDRLGDDLGQRRVHAEILSARSRPAACPPVCINSSAESRLCSTWHGMERRSAMVSRSASIRRL